MDLLHLQYLTFAPLANTLPINLKNEAILRCKNLSCPEQIKGRIEHFSSKLALDIDGLGKKITNLLVDHNYLKSISDIFLLDKATLKSLEGFGNKSAENLILAIETSKTISFSKFVSIFELSNLLTLKIFLVFNQISLFESCGPIGINN